MPTDAKSGNNEVRIDPVGSFAFLDVPPHPQGVVIFAHGSGSGRLQPAQQLRRRAAARRGHGHPAARPADARGGARPAQGVRHRAPGVAPDRRHAMDRGAPKTRACRSATSGRAPARAPPCSPPPSWAPTSPPWCRAAAARTWPWRRWRREGGRPADRRRRRPAGAGAQPPGAGRADGALGARRHSRRRPSVRGARCAGQGDRPCAGLVPEPFRARQPPRSFGDARPWNDLH